MDRKSNILLISPDEIGDKIAGPGIRYWEMSKALSRLFNVELLVPGEQSLPAAEFIIKKLTVDNLKKSLVACDIVIFQGLVLEKHPEIKFSGKYLVIDIYDPMMLENLENEVYIDKFEKRVHFNFILNGIKKQLLAGDYFICASEKQRDFWIGMLTAMDRVNPANYNIDKSFRKIVDVVSFGLSSEKPISTKKVLKGIYKGINVNDFIILWGGGVWNWFDPITLIKAMNILSVERPEIKLFFLGKRNPNSKMPEYLCKMYDKARDVAKDMQLLNKNVFFNDIWVPYNDRANYLLEADVGISCHFNFIENKYSFRSRILDYIWANLPIITNGGDSMSELVLKEKLGIVVESEDCDSLVQAILKLYEDKKFSRQCRENTKKLARKFNWNEVIKPLMHYCQNPYFAPDKDGLNEISLINQFQYNIIKAYRLFHREGFMSLLRRIRNIY